jgi:hypothetical protein
MSTHSTCLIGYVNGVSVGFLSFAEINVPTKIEAVAAIVAGIDLSAMINLDIQTDAPKKKSCQLMTISMRAL